MLRFCGRIRFHVEATPLSREAMGYACPLAQGKARVWLHLPCPGIPFYFKKARRTVSGSSGLSLFYGHLLARKGCGTAMFQPGYAAKHASYFHAQHMLPRFTRKEGMRTTRHAAGRHWRSLWEGPAQTPLHAQTPCKHTGQRPSQRPVSNAVSTAAAERRVYSYAAITASAFSTSAVS